MTTLMRAHETAAYAHEGQIRKVNGEAFITHPETVMAIASRVTRSEVTLSACLLHDVLEDVDSSRYSEADMRRDYGDTVTDIVKDVTKNPDIDDWREQNEAYLDVIRTTGREESVIVATADKIHNLSSVLSDYAELGETLWQHFSTDKADQVWWYNAVYDVVSERSPDNPLVAELGTLVMQLNETAGIAQEYEPAHS
jgi:(p)ppGpp synthase/HD superfamily hydrolase